MPPDLLASPEDPDERRRKAYEELRRDCQTGLRTTMLALLQTLSAEGLA